MTRIVGRAGRDSGPENTLKEWRACASRADHAPRTRSQAATILLDARAQARAIIADTMARIDADAATVRRQAWDAGYADGLAHGQRDIAAACQGLNVLISRAVTDYATSARNLDAAALSLAMATAHAVVRREITASPAIVLDVIRAALAEISVEPSITLRVHPDDEALVQPHLSSLGLPASVHVTVVPDVALSRGGCVVESGTGRVDATVETQMARIAAALREHLHAA